MENKEITVIPKLYDFILWFSGKVPKYPKNYKYTIGDRIISQSAEIMDSLIEARYTSKKKSHYLRRANVDLDKLRMFVRLSKDLHCITIPEYEFAAKALVEIGKMIGGWEKYSKEKESGEEI